MLVLYTIHYNLTVPINNYLNTSEEYNIKTLAFDGTVGVIHRTFNMINYVEGNILINLFSLLILYLHHLSNSGVEEYL
jgi:hypothetical protein